MAEAWPSEVPYAPRANSMRVTEPFRAPLATDFENGPSRGRRASTLNVAVVQFSIKMENDEFDLFKLWVRDALIDGTLPFDMRIWTGSDYEFRTCKFKLPRPYTDDPGRGIRHVVGVTLEVENY